MTVNTFQRDRAFSKFMQDKPTRAYYSTRGRGGIGGDLRDLRESMDGLALLREFDADRQFPLLADFNEIPVAEGLLAAKVYHSGIPEGYEKAAKTGAYTAGKDVILTAVKPGELGNKIEVTWEVGAGAAVAVFGTKVTITVKNDNATTPSDLQVLIAANKKLKQLIALTSTDNTAISAAWATAAGTWTLASGTGPGWGADVIGAWGAADSIAFIAAKAHLGYNYEIEWIDGAALAVVATRRKLSITYVDGVTLASAVVAAVNAIPIALEHLTALATGAGSGALTGLDGKSSKLTSDISTSLFVNKMAAMITEVTSTYIKFDLDALAGVSGGGSIGIDLRLGMLKMGGVCVSTAPDDIVEEPGDLATLQVWDGRTVVVRESAGAGTPPALYVYNSDTPAWVNLLSTGLPANHATTHRHAGTDEVLDVIVAVNADGAVAATTGFEEGTGGGVGITRTLYASAAGNTGRQIKVKKVDVGAGTVTYDCTLADLIDGAATLVLASQYDSAILESTGTGWHIVSRHPVPAAHGATHLQAGADAVHTAAVTPAGYPYTVLAADKTILATCPGAGVTNDIALPVAAAGWVGRSHTIVTVVHTGGTLTITPDGAELLNGAAAPFIISAPAGAVGDSATVECTAAGEWWITAFSV